MKRALAALILLLAGCAGPQRADIISSCELRPGTTLEVVTGWQVGCEDLVKAYGPILSEYEARFGPVDLQGWTVRAWPGRVDGDGHTGLTWHAERVIDISGPVLNALPHEAHHVRLGPTSGDHHGWCSDFEPWEVSTFGYGEVTYLGCTN